jgi:DNA polymerase-3 subunit beta
MKIQVELAKILPALQHAGAILPQRTGASYLRTIWLRAEEGRVGILATDSAIELSFVCRAEVAEPGMVGVPGRQFVELIKRLPGGEPVSLSVDGAGGVLHVVQERRKYKLPLNDVAWFSPHAETPKKGAVRWSGEFFREVLDRVAFCLGDDSSDALSCGSILSRDGVRVEVAAMDGHQMALYTFDNADISGLLPAEGVLISGKYIKNLSRWLNDNEMYVVLTEDRLFLHEEGDSEPEQSFFSVPLSKYVYPDYSTFLQRLKGENISTLTIGREELRDVLSRIGLFLSVESAIAKFTLTADEAVITAVSKDVGEGVESMSVEYAGSIERISFPSEKLLRVLEHFESIMVKIVMTGEASVCCLTGDADADLGYQVVVMPMQVLDGAGEAKA